jgi:D-alanyl-D-alanine carboxypeptidase
MAVHFRCRRPWLWRGIAALIAASVGTLPPAAGARAEAKKSAVLVIDANTGRVLHQSAADEPRYPASLAKMMTIYIAFELIEQGRLSYQTKIKFSANAVAAAPSKLDVEEGEQILLIDAIKILITKSANDVAVALAEHIAGSEEKFARLMTRKGRQLGMSATTFRNASGLPDDDQVTTARDMVTLALRLQDDFPKHYQLFATRTATFKDDTFRNHNTLLFHYEGTDGLKTGYTRASGFNLVASVRRGKKHVIGAVFGGASASSRNTAIRTFLNMGLVKASSEKTRQPTAPLIAQAPRPANPKIAAVPTPNRVPRPPASSAAPPPSPDGPPLAEPAAIPPPERPSAATVEIARVRSVLVAPRAAVPDAEPARAPAPHDPPVAEPAALPPPSLPHWTAAANLLPPPPSEPPADKPPPFNDITIVRGAAPASFEAQVSKLARGEPPVAAPVTTAALAPPPRAPSPRGREPAAQPAASSAGRGFQIQIGAYQSAAEADRQLAAVRERANGLLAGGTPVTLPVQQGQKSFFRARYSGFDATAAARACDGLKRLKIDCLVVRAE